MPEWVRGAVGFDALWREVRTLEQARPALGFPTDGVVVKLDDAALRARLGESDSAPNWAIAHKFEPERVETRLRAITLPRGSTATLWPSKTSSSCPPTKFVYTICTELRRACCRTTFSRKESLPL